MSRAVTEFACLINIPVALMMFIHHCSIGDKVKLIRHKQEEAVKTDLKTFLSDFFLAGKLYNNQSCALSVYFFLRTQKEMSFFKVRHKGGKKRKAEFIIFAQLKDYTVQGDSESPEGLFRPPP